MTIYAYTSITLNYLPKARILAQSFKRYHPEVKFVLLLSEPAPFNLVEAFPEFDEVVQHDQLDIPEWKQWTFFHSIVEICTAVKGKMLTTLLQRPGSKVVFYYDPDTVLFSRQDELYEALENHSILLTPHLLDPEQTSMAIEDNELCALRHGVYNLGFLGVKNTPEGNRFAQWWQSRLDQYCYADIPSGIFTDQRWVDLAPAYFKELKIIQDRAYNVATWNIAHRFIEGSFENGFTVNNKPLRFYHFSGFDSGAQLAMLDRYAGGMKAAFVLRDWYIQRSIELDAHAFASTPWKYHRYDNGVAITSEARKLYRKRIDLQRAFPDPFQTADFEQSYLRWFEVNGIPTAELRSPDYGHLARPFQPLSHFLEHVSSVEQKEDYISPHPLFDADFYLRNNLDVARAGINPYIHYLATGAEEKRDPHPLFAASYYVSQAGEAAHKNPLIHYLENGAKNSFDPHPLFSTEFYRSQSPTFEREDDSPLMHFLYRGAERHLDPHPLFNTAHFLNTVNCRGMNPLSYFLLHGAPADSVIPSHKFKSQVCSKNESEGLIAFIVDDAQSEGSSNLEELKKVLSKLSLVKKVIVIPGSEKTPAAVIGREHSKDPRLDLVIMSSLSQNIAPWLKACSHPCDNPRIGACIPYSIGGVLFPFTQRAPESIGIDEISSALLATNEGKSLLVSASDGICIYAYAHALTRVPLEELDSSSVRAYVLALSGEITRSGLQTKLISSAYVGGPEESLEVSQKRYYSFTKSYPEVDILVQNQKKMGKIDEFQRPLILELLRRDSRPKVLCIGHHLGGGTEAHVRDLAAHYGENAVFLFMHREANDPRAMHITILNKEYPFHLSVGISASYRELSNLVKDIGVTMMHIHHFIGLEDNIRGIYEALNLPLTTTLHDYYLLSPNPHLTDGERFGGEPDEKVIGSLYLENPFTPAPPSLSAWRERHAWILREAQCVIAPSVDVKKRFQRYYPEVSISVSPHPFSALDQYKVVKARQLQETESLRVVVLGALAIHKGSEVLEQCARVSKEKNLPLDFLLIGYGHRALMTKPVANLRVSGKYTNQEMELLLEDYQPHLAWFPSLCPETFSYTLSEVFTHNLPVLVSNLGALPERVAERPWSWIAPWNNSVDEWIETLLSIRAHFLEGKESKAPGHLPVYDTNLYANLFIGSDAAA